MRVALGLFRLLLFLYSRRFRRTWGDDMVLAFALRLERAARLGGRRREIATLLAGLGDLVVGAATHRVSPSIRAPFPNSSSPRLPRQREERHVINRFLWNLRHATRGLLRQPVTSAVIILTLALGAGGTVAFFGIADAALVRPLPYPEPERLVSLSQSSERFGRYGWAGPFVTELKARSSSYDELVGFSPSWTMTMTDPGEPRVVDCVFITDGLLDLFGARLVAGRGFSADEHLPDAPPVVVVSENFWRRHVGDSTQPDGQTLTLDGTAFRIVGVVDDTLRMPLVSPASAGATPLGLWIPLAQNQFLSSRARPLIRVVARLAADTSLEAAADELRAVNAGFASEFPDSGISTETAVVSLASRMTLGSRSIVTLMFGAAAFLLCIACANVANLLLARASARTHEISIRASLGATRARIIEQLLSESVLLSLVAGVAGLGLAAWLLKVIPALGFLTLPASSIVQLDLRVVSFAVVLALATSLLFGLAPAIHLSRSGASLVPGGGPRTTQARASRVRGGLVAAEVALAVVLLIGAGLLTRSFTRLSTVDPGFQTERILTAPVTLGTDRWPTSAERRSFHDQLQDRLEALPEVEAVAAVNRVPLSGGNVFVGVEFESGNNAGEPVVTMDRRVVTPGYFRTLGIPVQSGRDFGPSDLSDAEDPVAILNQTALALLANPNAVGQRVRLQLRDGFGPWLRVVGVVGDIRHHGLDEPASAEIYVPFEQASVRSMTLLVRTAQNPRSLIAPFREQVWQLDDELALDGLAPLSDLVDASITDPRVRMLMLQSFAALALALAGLGIGGVVSYAVARRSRDYGIRVALGARSSEILRLALRDGLVPGALGAIVGTVAAVGLSRFVASMLYATSPTDPITFVGVTGLLLAIVTLASWLPARRATRVDPVTILRED